MTDAESTQIVDAWLGVRRPSSGAFSLGRVRDQSDEIVDALLGVPRRRHSGSFSVDGLDEVADDVSNERAGPQRVLEEARELLTADEFAEFEDLLDRSSRVGAEERRQRLLGFIQMFKKGVEQAERKNEL